MNILIILFLIASAQAQNSKPWTISPDGQSGTLTSMSSEADLKAIFGEQNVRRGEIGVGEGGFESGTILFPDDPLKRLELLWTDAERKSPKTVFVGGVRNAAFADKSVWRTSNGIGLGTTLRELERINRRPFRLSGFGWDYSGTILSWGGGALEHVFGSGSDKKVYLRLIYSDSAAPEINAVQGDRDFSSGHPAMQKINPHIYQMVFNFKGHP